MSAWEWTLAEIRAEQWQALCTKLTETYYMMHYCEPLCQVSAGGSLEFMYALKDDMDYRRLERYEEQSHVWPLV